MTLDEYITSLRLSIAKHITIFDCTTNEEHKKMAADLIEESKQVLEWLEELKAKRNIGECAYKQGYNKAVNDFTIMLLTNDVIDRSVVKRCAIQLKVGGKNEID